MYSKTGHITPEIYKYVGRNVVSSDIVLHLYAMKNTFIVFNVV